MKTEVRDECHSSLRTCETEYARVQTETQTRRDLQMQVLYKFAKNLEDPLRLPETRVGEFDTSFI